MFILFFLFFFGGGWGVGRVQGHWSLVASLSGRLERWHTVALAAALGHPTAEECRRDPRVILGRTNPPRPRASDHEVGDVAVRVPSGAKLGATLEFDGSAGDGCAFVLGIEVAHTLALSPLHCSLVSPPPLSTQPPLCPPVCAGQPDGDAWQRDGQRDDGGGGISSVAERGTGSRACRPRHALCGCKIWGRPRHALCGCTFWAARGPRREPRSVDGGSARGCKRRAEGRGEWGADQRGVIDAVDQS